MHRFLRLLALAWLAVPACGFGQQRGNSPVHFAVEGAGHAVSSTSAGASALLAQVTAGAPRSPSVSNVGGRAERPDIRVGDRWKYRVTDKFTNLTHSVSIAVMTVTENRIHTGHVESALDAASLPAAGGIVGVWDRDWNQLSQGATVYKPFYPVLQFPLEPGKQWSGTVQWDSGSGTLRHQLTMQVAGWERVTVPAGSFDAVRITVRGYISESQSRNYYAQDGSIANVIWYAPAVGQIVKKETDHRDNTPIALGRLLERWELVEYRPH